MYISESAKSKANVRKSDRRFVISGAEIMFKVLGTRSDGLKEDSQPCVGGEREQEKEGRKRERERERIGAKASFRQRVVKGEI